MRNVAAILSACAHTEPDSLASLSARFRRRSYIYGVTGRLCQPMYPSAGSLVALLFGRPSPDPAAQICTSIGFAVRVIAFDTADMQYSYFCRLRALIRRNQPPIKTPNDVCASWYFRLAFSLCHFTIAAALTRTHTQILTGAFT